MTSNRSSMNDNRSWVMATRFLGFLVLAASLYLLAAALLGHRESELDYSRYATLFLVGPILIWLSFQGKWHRNIAGLVIMTAFSSFRVGKSLWNSKAPTDIVLLWGVVIPATIFLFVVTISLFVVMVRPIWERSHSPDSQPEKSDT